VFRDGGTILPSTYQSDEREAEAIARKQTGSFYRPELDVLRLFAFLCVFCTHGVKVNLSGGVADHHKAIGHAIAFIARAGEFGLPLFFFLSAFLITTLLLIEKGKTGQVHLRSFYIRRILRIWPLYFGFLTIIFMVGLLWRPAHFSTHALLALFLLSGNWYVIKTGLLPDVILFLWSISIEEQFYLLWPALVRKFSPSRIQVLCIGLAAISIIAITLLAASGSVVFNIWCNTATQMLFFAGGGLLALQVGLVRQQKSAWKAIGALFLGLACWTVADLFRGPRLNFDRTPAAQTCLSYIFVCLGCSALLWAFLHIPQKLLHPKLVYLGRISYGLYIFQGISLVVGERFVQPHLKGGLWLPISLGMTVLLAIPSYEFFEKPFLKLKHRFEFVHSRPA
jgi:peptidoglycan/LPS O-acetylase OafA/YrhL